MAWVWWGQQALTVFTKALKVAAAEVDAKMLKLSDDEKLHAVLSAVQSIMPVPGEWSESMVVVKRRE